VCALAVKVTVHAGIPHFLKGVQIVGSKVLRTGLGSAAQDPCEEIPPHTPGLLLSASCRQQGAAEAHPGPMCTLPAPTSLAGAQGATS
jgi:hypothetical protein